VCCTGQCLGGGLCGKVPQEDARRRLSACMRVGKSEVSPGRGQEGERRSLLVEMGECQHSPEFHVSGEVGLDWESKRLGKNLRGKGGKKREKNFFH